MAATTTWNPITIRDGEVDSFPGSTGPATAVYHGAIAMVNSSGYAEDYTSTGLPKLVGVVYSVMDQAGSTGNTITTQGNMNTGNNNVVLYTKGRIVSIPFNSDLTAASVGKLAWAIDNFTLSPNPAASTFMSPLGVITKYYSATKGEVIINSYERATPMMKAGILTTSSSSIMMAIPNPLGVDIVLKDFTIVVTTATTSAAAVSAGIATTSTGVATDVIATGAFTPGTTGVYGTAKTTNFFGNVYWGATKYLTLSSSSAISVVPVGFYKMTYEVW